MYSTNNRSVITFTFYNCCCRCRCRCRWYCCMWLLIWLDSAVKTIHRMNLIYLLTTHSLSLSHWREISHCFLRFYSVRCVCVRVFCAHRMLKILRCANEMGVRILNTDEKKIVLIILLIGMNGISYIHLCEWIQFKYTQSSKQAAELPHTFAAQFSLSNDAALKWIR